MDTFFCFRVVLEPKLRNSFMQAIRNATNRMECELLIISNIFCLINLVLDDFPKRRLASPYVSTKLIQRSYLRSSKTWLSTRMTFQGRIDDDFMTHAYRQRLTTPYITSHLLFFITYQIDFYHFPDSNF